MSTAQIPTPSPAPLDRRHLEHGKLHSMTVMATGIAHDFNNHLAAIVGNNSVLQRSLPDAGRSRDCVKRIESAANLAVELSNQLALYSSRVVCETSAIDWLHLIGEVEQALKCTLPKGLQITYAVAANAPALTADPKLLQQALANLITNSAESMIERSGGIRVSVDLFERHGSDADDAFFELGETPHWAALSVSDDGCGIAGQNRALIFDPFFSTKIRGRGMGLPEVLGIARLHGGNIIVNSQPGVGTTVKLLLPPEPPAA